MALFLKKISALACLAVATTPLFAADADAGRDLREAVSRMGYRIGFDAERKVFVFTGRKLAEMESPSDSKGFFLQREKCFKVAELKAKAALLRYMRQTWTGGEFLDAGEVNGLTQKKLVSVAESFSANKLSGWHVLASAESYNDGVYEVAAAVIWSPALESAGRKAREGRLRPAASYREELREWLRAQQLETWCGCRAFVDSSGFPHLLGVGVVDADGASPMEMTSIRMKGDLLARKNLLLGLWGDSEVGKFARDAVSSESADEKDADTESLFESMASVEVRGKAVDGLTLVHEQVVRNRITGRTALVVLYGVEPSKLECGGNAARQLAEPAVPDVQIREAPGLKVFNPSTGKFEKQKRE